jgi:hypothetical protein
MYVIAANGHHEIPRQVSDGYRGISRSEDRHARPTDEGTQHVGMIGSVSGDHFAILKPELSRSEDGSFDFFDPGSNIRSQSLCRLCLGNGAIPIGRRFSNLAFKTQIRVPNVRCASRLVANTKSVTTASTTANGGDSTGEPLTYRCLARHCHDRRLPVAARCGDVDTHTWTVPDGPRSASLVLDSDNMSRCSSKVQQPQRPFLTGLGKPDSVRKRPSVTFLPLDGKEMIHSSTRSGRLPTKSVH